MTPGTMSSSPKSAAYDVIIIGGGPGGYVAAIRCAQLGLRTACVDAQVNPRGEPALGGACLNVGCIPSKALLDSSEQFARIQHQAADHGIRVGDPVMDIAAMHARKDTIVATLTNGISQLFKANQVEWLHARGQLLPDCAVALSAPADHSAARGTIRATHIILAPGAAPIALPNIPFAPEAVVDSTAALSFTSVPPRLGIIGAGAIGLELGSVWNRLGAEVVILEALDELLEPVDRQIARQAARQFKQQGLDIRLGARVQQVQAQVQAQAKSKSNADGGGLQIHYQQKQSPQKQQPNQSVTVDRVIVAVGRRPATAGLLSPKCGVSLDAAGFIEVDAQCRTRAQNVWAVGDAVRGPMLAHKSSEEGAAVAERIKAGRAQVGHVDFNTVPWVIYTAPEIAWVGQTESQLNARGVAFRSGAFPFSATGRALAMGEPVGMVKMLADRQTDRLLGVHMIGPHAAELIAECVLAMEYQASAEDLARTMHAHPTLSEAVREAALAVDQRAIHQAPKPKAR